MVDGTTHRSEWRPGPKTLLVGLAVLVAAAALLIPEAPLREEGGRSSYSTAAGGSRMAFELATRMGWQTERRLTPLDSAPAAPTVQAVLAPQQALGAHEVHRLLMNVRRGGGLIFTLDGGDEIADSLGVGAGKPGRFLSSYGDPDCATPTSFRDRALLALPPAVSQIVWRRPPPGLVTPLAMTHARIEAGFPVGVGFPLGRGRVAVVSTSALFSNDVIRLCGMGADVVVARTFEFMRPAAATTPPLVFDEYHHGFGIHGGSLRAISHYLIGTPSGRFLTAVLCAGLLLVLARAPRPIVPRDPERIVRRSPLEHADALGHAYADVGATRTATARLVGGLRRRAGRMVAVPPGADDAAFLDGVASRHPELSGAVAKIRRALAEPTSPRELVAVGDALNDIERYLTTSPSPRT